MSEGLERVTRAEPCAICSSPDWCARLTRYHLCMRVESDKPAEKGGWLHLRDGATSVAPIPKRKPRAPDSEITKRWTPVALNAHKSGIDSLPRLALQLGVSTASLVLLTAGYVDDVKSPFWTFPERNAAGEIIGINRRFAAPEGGRGKLYYKGSRPGLIYCDGWFTRSGPIYIVEGASDTAAGLTMGLCVIGRPSNIGGIDLLVRLLRSHAGRQIVVVGERDQKSPEHVLATKPQHKPNCPACSACWPGKYGMRETAKRLSAALRRQVGACLPPAKDMREWLNRMGIDVDDAQQCEAACRLWKKLVRA